MLIGSTEQPDFQKWMTNVGLGDLVTAGTSHLHSILLYLTLIQLTVECCMTVVQLLFPLSPWGCSRSRVLDMRSLASTYAELTRELRTLKVSICVVITRQEYAYEQACSLPLWPLGNHRLGGMRMYNQSILLNAAFRKVNL
jgi:hypothetical protein